MKNCSIKVAVIGPEATVGRRQAHRPCERGERQLRLPQVRQVHLGRVTQRLLTREGYRVVLAADGLQALADLHRHGRAFVGGRGGRGGGIGFHQHAGC